MPTSSSAHRRSQTSLLATIISSSTKRNDRGHSTPSIRSTSSAAKKHVAKPPPVANSQPRRCSLIEEEEVGDEAARYETVCTEMAVLNPSLTSECAAAESRDVPAVSTDRCCLDDDDDTTGTLRASRSDSSVLTTLDADDSRENVGSKQTPKVIQPGSTARMVTLKKSKRTTTKRKSLSSRLRKPRSTPEEEERVDEECLTDTVSLVNQYYSGRAVVDANGMQNYIDQRSSELRAVDAATRYFQAERAAVKSTQALVSRLSVQPERRRSRKSAQKIYNNGSGGDKTGRGAPAKKRPLPKKVAPKTTKARIEDMRRRTSGKQPRTTVAVATNTVAVGDGGDTTTRTELYVDKHINDAIEYINLPSDRSATTLTNLNNQNNRPGVIDTDDDDAEIVKKATRKKKSRKQPQRQQTERRNRIVMPQVVVTPRLICLRSMMGGGYGIPTSVPDTPSYVYLCYVYVSVPSVSLFSFASFMFPRVFTP